MKKLSMAVFVVLMVTAFVAINAGAADKTPAPGAAAPKKIEKFGEDKRAKEWAGKKWESSAKKYTLRMSDP